MKKQKNNKNKFNNSTSNDARYAPQAINRADSRQKNSNVAIPNDENVMVAKEWVTFNEK